MKSLFKAFGYIAILLSSVFVSTLSFADTQTAPVTETETLFTQELDQATLLDQATMAVLVKENTRCIRCHQKERLLKQIKPITSVGKHKSEANLDNCTACHGNKGDHPIDNQVIISHVPTDYMTIETQNEQCMDCHKADELAEKEWTHDVHEKDVNCSSCHSLHQEIDPIINAEKSFRVKLCVDCHRDPQAKKKLIMKEGN